MVEASQRYGAGLPRVGTRAVDSTDVAWVRRTVRAAWTWVFLGLSTATAATAATIIFPAASMWSAGTVVAIAGSFAILVRGSARMRWVVATGWALQLVFFGVSAFRPEARPVHPALVLALQAGTALAAIAFLGQRLLHAATVLRRTARLRGDLAAGVVERFEGRLRDAGHARTFRALVRSHDLVDLGQPHVLEVLPSSGLLVRVNGKPPARLLLVPTASLAASAPHALRVPLPPDLATVASPDVALERRSLTPAERDELARITAEFRRPSWPLWVLVPCTLTLAAWPYLHPTEPWFGLLAAFVHMGTGASVFHFVQRLRTASRLGADRTLRWLVTVTDRKASPSATPHLEMLAMSRMAWTEHGQPAQWRRARGRE